MFSKLIVEYNSENVVIVSNNMQEEMLVIYYDNLQPKIKKIIVWLTGLYNDNIEEAIKEVLNNSGVDIEEEIELYRKSELYNIINEYNN